MFKRHFNLFLLLLIFAFGQISLVSHEISHYADIYADSNNVQQKQGANPSESHQKTDKDVFIKTCVTCLAYSIIAASNIVNPVIFRLAMLEQHYYLADGVVSFSRHFTFYPARAPPVLV